MFAYLTLLALSKKAGLTVEEHECVRVTGNAGYGAVKQALAPFPNNVTAVGTDGFTMNHGPTELYLEILDEGGQIPKGCTFQVHRSPCKCKTKHGLVPAHSPELWARALETTPLAAAVTTEARFLGAIPPI